MRPMIRRRMPIDDLGSSCWNRGSYSKWHRTSIFSMSCWLSFMRPCSFSWGDSLFMSKMTRRFTSMSGLPEEAE